MKVSLRIDAAGSVTVRVYNAAQAWVRTLWEGEMAAGWTTLDWDGRNAHGETVGSGTYYVVVRAPGVKSVKRVVLIR